VAAVIFNAAAGHQQIIEIHKAEGEVKEDVVHEALERHPGIF
jgi:hypothetical protein